MMLMIVLCSMQLHTHASAEQLDVFAGAAQVRITVGVHALAVE